MLANALFADLKKSMSSLSVLAVRHVENLFLVPVDPEACRLEQRLGWQEYGLYYPIELIS